jgi:hypothetical protein
MPRRRTSTPVAAALLTLVVAGCGGPAPAPAGPPPPPRDPAADAAALVAAKGGEPCRPVVTEPGEVAYWGLGVRTYPAPAGTPARLTAQDALTGQDVRDWGPAASTDVELRLVSTGGYGCESHPTGTVRQPGWVVIIHGTTAAIRGGPGHQDPDPLPACDSMVIVDAGSGALLDNSQWCGEDTAVRSAIPG